MAPNKLENQFREILHDREIKPSAQAWDRLDAMLSAQETDENNANNRKNEKKFHWLMVAAIFLGFVLVGTIFFKTNVVETNIIDLNNDVVVTNKNKMPTTEIQKLNEDENANSENFQNPNIISKNKISNNVVVAVSNKKFNNQKSNDNEVSIIKNSQNLIVKINESTNELNTNEIKKQDLVSNQNQVAAAQIISSNQETENNLSTNIGTIKSIKVDANSLLSEVDKEITNQYRETVFQKIGKNFQAVRVAFAERNIKK